MGNLVNLALNLTADFLRWHCQFLLPISFYAQCPLIMSILSDSSQSFGHIPDRKKGLFKSIRAEEPPPPPKKNTFTLCIWNLLGKLFSTYSLCKIFRIYLVSECYYSQRHLALYIHSHYFLNLSYLIVPIPLILFPLVY